MNNERTKNRYADDKFAAHLGMARLEKNWSQKELAKEVGLSETIISEYENGKKQPMLATAKRLATILGVSLDWLCGLTESSHFEHFASLSMYSAIRALKLRIDSIGDDRIVLSYRDYGPEVFGKEIQRFFEDYAKLQMVEEAYSNTPGGSDIIEQIKNNLLNRYKSLPNIPEYDIAKEKVNYEPKRRKGSIRTEH